ncbi:putative transferase [Helianthus debilis subsp. tardiflorus]
MATLPILTILEKTRVSPPAATVGDSLLPLTYFDFLWLSQPPVQNIFFYELPITQTQFNETIIPNLKRSLSITLQHLYPFAGNLIVFHTSTQKPEIRYVEGDSVAVTFTECNLDFKKLTGNHPRNCEMFDHLIPQLGEANKTSDSTKIPVFAVQVTFFPNSGISIGMTNHHCLGDASTRFLFLKAWTSTARFGLDKSFLADGTLPLYDRVVNNPKLDENFLKYAKVENFEYQPTKLCGPTDRVRGTFILPRTMLNRLKNLVSTRLPTLPYVSSFTVACAYMWSCIAKTREEELHLFSFTIDCRARMNPAIPAAYFGNCVGWCAVNVQSKQLMGKEGFVTAAKLIGENLHKTLNDKDGIVKERKSSEGSVSSGIPMTIIGVAGTPKLKFYDLDFGWGKPKKLETVSTGLSFSINGSKENNEDLEIGISLPATHMESFVRIFEDGLKEYI